jgi:hypothetical protein
VHSLFAACSDNRPLQGFPRHRRVQGANYEDSSFLDVVVDGLVKSLESVSICQYHLEVLLLAVDLIQHQCQA